MIVLCLFSRRPSDWQCTIGKSQINYHPHESRAFTKAGMSGVRDASPAALDPRVSGGIIGYRNPSIGEKL